MIYLTDVMKRQKLPLVELLLAGENITKPLSSWLVNNLRVKSINKIITSSVFER